ncbi:hypothetical protein PIROE2DRAFT_18294 [Piromyces sp. E2]|nr:hypothetical protein PIROE2DRAFT_18294 [Piromyces sp. E2]|eukprot:OUM56893.1 hypothetical protein PIROE2DRAFT_18294 [Piromyces sp. E2]
MYIPYEHYNVEITRRKRCNGDIQKCVKESDRLEIINKYYIIRIPLTIEGPTTKCKDSFKSTARFEDSKGELPVSFNTYNNQEYTLEFTTKDDCAFKVYCAEYTYFPSNVKLYLDSGKIARVSKCKYHISEKVICNVDIKYGRSKKTQQCNEDNVCKNKTLHEDRIKTFELTMDLRLKKNSPFCYEAVIFDPIFEDVKLIYDDNKTANLLADRTNDVKKITLPASFGTYQNRKYYFRFSTRTCQK